MILLIWYINKLNVYVFIREKRERLSVQDRLKHTSVCVCMCVCVHAHMLLYWNTHTRTKFQDAGFHHLLI